jgi:hypothetical protein
VSGLAAVLAGHTAPGLHTWRSGLDVADVRHAVEQAGWRFAHVDGLVAQTKPAFLRTVGEALDFPAWYGQNFDALADCLGDVDGDGTVLLWDGWGVLARDEPRAFSVALSVLGTRVHAERRAPFTVLLRGDGPPLPDVPPLD